MLRNPKNHHSPSVTTLALRTASAVLFGLGLAAAQDAGTHNLPSEIADAGVKVQKVMGKTPDGSRNLGYSEGPAADLEGNLYFTEDNSGQGNIWKVNAAGASSNFFHGPSIPNGLEFDNIGKLFSAEMAAVATYDVKVGASSRTKLTMSVTLAPNIRINDLSVGSNGGVWFTNQIGGNQYFYRDPSGQVTTYDNIAPLGVPVPNGIEWIEEKKILLITSSNDNKVFQFDVSADFKPSNKKLFANVPIPDGLTVDANGNIYIASFGSGKVYVFAPTGGTGGVVGMELGTIDVQTGGQKKISNCAFGGPGNKTLYMTGTGGAYKIQLKIPGRTRPGVAPIRLRTGSLRIAPRPFSEGYTIAGRKVDLVQAQRQAPGSFRNVIKTLPK
ncbi:MAG TPA: SMP-30/gluconolactonase/LRE family protein [Fibrobacteria bacterium]|nr:SMP-30/gluconolactonase/LRE family protein [Fibrobacteria bacterium]